MSITDNDRRLLHSAIEAVCGGRPAEVLMELLPQSGWSDVARTKDIEVTAATLRREMAELRTELKTEMAELRTEMAELRTELKTEMAELRTEMAELRTELKTEMAELRTELKTEMAELRTAMERGFRNQGWKIFSAMIAMQTSTLGFIGFLALHHRI